MTREKYNRLIIKENERHSNNENAIKRKFALENNPYKIGDKIKSNSDFIEILQINIVMYTEPPECYYYGYSLKKDGSRLKSGKMSIIYQSDIVEK